MIGRSAHVPGPSDDCETPHFSDDSDVRATEPWLLAREDQVHALLSEYGEGPAGATIVVRCAADASPRGRATNHDGALKTLRT